MARTNTKAVEANAIGAYVTALFDAMVATAKADDLAYAMVKDCADVEATNKVRDDFKAAYTARRKSDDGAAFDADKCKASADMAWSRVCAKAKDRGWVKPVAETKGAKNARESRAKASAGKVDGRTTRTGSRNKGSAKKVDVIVPDAGDDEELQAAFDWVMEDDTRMTLFVKWVEAQQKGTRTIRRAA
jgi:hypothetical protein